MPSDQVSFLGQLNDGCAMVIAGDHEQKQVWRDPVARTYGRTLIESHCVGLLLGLAGVAPIASQMALDVGQGAMRLLLASQYTFSLNCNEPRANNGCTCGAGRLRKRGNMALLLLWDDSGGTANRPMGISGW
ncbi:hypothetical protein [Pseudomonas aeruginosa]|uniref:hypothetical protein n=1 Tax=Pseudomonas aeruginosa TaxID=287 RepID=UPI003FD00C16